MFLSPIKSFASFAYSENISDIWWWIVFARRALLQIIPRKYFSIISVFIYRNASRVSFIGRNCSENKNRVDLIWKVTHANGGRDTFFALFFYELDIRTQAMFPSNCTARVTSKSDHYSPFRSHFFMYRCLELRIRRFRLSFCSSRIFNAVYNKSRSVQFFFM